MNILNDNNIWNCNKNNLHSILENHKMLLLGEKCDRKNSMEIFVKRNTINITFIVQ